MVSGWRYRVGGAGGTVLATLLAVAIFNHPEVTEAMHAFPVIGHLPAEPAVGGELLVEAVTAAVVVSVAFSPLYKPRPRRILDAITSAQKRVIFAVLALATIGYFDYTYRLPRLTLLGVGSLLLVVLPAWFVGIRHQPNGETERALIVGDDRDQIERIVTESGLAFYGYLCPSNLLRPRDERGQPKAAITDGGMVTENLTRLGGLSGIEDAFLDLDINTAVLAFKQPDRAEFFGALHACWEHGVTPLVHEAYSEKVLTRHRDGSLVEVAVEPWDPQDYALKRLYDVLFAASALLVLLPSIVIIAIAIKIDSNGPILFKQPRTTRFGRTFTFYKFRSMVQDAEAETGVVVSREDAGEVDPRVTRVGRWLRQTHLDEIPQLWSILKGDMSVVGPRPAQTEIEDEFEAETPEWVKRWFVKPGLTGLAQIEGATGLEPERKLHYDLLYIQRQSLVLDLKITIRQFWQDAIEAYEYLTEH